MSVAVVRSILRVGLIEKVSPEIGRAVVFPVKRVYRGARLRGGDIFRGRAMTNW